MPPHPETLHRSGGHRTPVNCVNKAPAIEEQDEEAAIRRPEPTGDPMLSMLAYLCIAKEAEASLSRKVEILDRFDLGDSQIARVCGVAVQSVRNARLTTKKRPRTS